MSACVIPEIILHAHITLISLTCLSKFCLKNIMQTYCLIKNSHIHILKHKHSTDEVQTDIYNGYKKFKDIGGADTRLKLCTSAIAIQLQ